MIIEYDFGNLVKNAEKDPLTTVMNNNQKNSINFAQNSDSNPVIPNRI
jgi:hypothetical protein